MANVLQLALNKGFHHLFFIHSIIYNFLQTISDIYISDSDSPYFCVHLYDICGEGSAHFYGKEKIKAELCFHCFQHFACVRIYIFDFHHKQCASD